MTPTLRISKIVETARLLSQRIEERFPDSGLHHLCEDLVRIAEATRDRAMREQRPYLLLRGGIIAILGAAAGVLGWVVLDVGAPLASGAARTGVFELTGFLEASANLAILGGTGIWFLASLEERLRRRNLLEHLHELRSMAHVVDMHQLTKDPVVLLRGGERTKSSPRREMSSFQLGRYLDYCTEMLAIIGKLAAIYGERTRDAQVIAGVNDLEVLTTGLGRKIWQKIMVLHDHTA